jgi:hypothetical protein
MLLSVACFYPWSPMHRDADSSAIGGSSAALPADHVYNWSAFNKLLLLGMYAPVEEAHTCAEPAQAQLVQQQLQQLQAARQVRVCAAGHMHVQPAWLDGASNCHAVEAASVCDQDPYSTQQTAPQ